MTSPATTTRHRALLTTILAAAMAIAIFPAGAIGVLSRFIIDDFGVSRTQIGWAVSALTITGAIMSPAAGWVTDHLGGRKAVLTLFAISTMGLVAIGVSPTYGFLVVAVLVAGLAQAIANPATNKLIVTTIPVGQRGWVTGIKQSGVQAGAFLGGLVLPATALALGWHEAMLLATFAPVVMLAVAARFLPPDSARPVGGGDRPVAGQVPMAAWWLAGFGLFMGFGQGATVAYLPLYSQEVVGFGVKTAGLVAALMGFVAVLLRILWSRLSEGRRHFSIPLTLLAAGAVGGALLLWSAGGQGGWAVWAGAGFLGATAYSWNSVGMLAVMAASEGDNAGRASGVVLAGFSVGLSTGPPLFGFLVDHTGHYDWGLGAVTAAFLVALVVVIVWGRVSRVPELRHPA